MNLSLMRKYGHAIRLSAEMALRQNVMDLFIIFTVFIQPFIIAVLALWVLQDRGGDYAIFVIVGSGMTGLWSSLLFISGNSITVERWLGTLESVASTPTPMQVIVFGKNLAHVTQSLGSMILSYLVVSLIFGYAVQINQPGLFTASLLFTVIAFVCFGLIIAALFILNPDVQRWQNGLEFPVYILSGFLFPIALLPLWTTPLSYLLPPYWAAQALHATAQGTATLSSVAFNWGMLILFSLIYLSVAAKLFEVILRKARVDATLGMQ